MTLTTDDTATQQLTLPQELILMLLNEETGYFRQIAGWDLNCAVVGAVLAELSLQSRIDTDMESLFLIDETETGDPVLDPFLKAIGSETAQHDAQYWIERFASHADAVIDSVLGRLVDLEILDHHEGDYWTLSSRVWQSEMMTGSQDGTATQFVKARITNVIFNNEIPDPRDIIIISLINTCDVIRFIFQLDEESEERIEQVCRMDLIARAIGEAVAHNMVGPALRRPSLSKPIPVVPLRELVFNRHVRDGNLNALFADIAEKHGPVYQIRPPFQKRPITVLAGAETNYWVHRHGRNYLRARDYLQDFEKVYGASGILPALDGADHFRYRKSMSSAYSRTRLESHLQTLYQQARTYMSNWSVGDALPATRTCRLLVNSQMSPIMISVDSQDLIDDLIDFKTRALSTHVVKVLPKFLLNTPGMRRKKKKIYELVERVQSIHTPAQRAGCPRDLADDLLSLHASDPQFLPESNLGFVFSAALIASVYLGDGLGFVVYAMASQPELYKQIQLEADALFADGDPDNNAYTPEAIDVTRRFIMETLRLYAIVPMSLRTVMNTCSVEGYELEEGTPVHIAQAATHYMEDFFPDPYKFDIDRYLPPRNEHLSPGYAPYGLGTHTCLGSRWMELQLAVNALMIAHYFTLEVPANHKFKISPFPSLSVDKKLKFLVTEQRREIPV
ncbi:MAG: cytochrome P450 [Chloroflexi bacterium]|nr:cytochrome P450 [Chloroflexota bacterium]MYF79971.1 cytochrome P450 [Chloroflexota bacterium]MYK60674.1 cytochrome P450 [Chloroflexota bacterium]